MVSRLTLFPWLTDFTTTKTILRGRVYTYLFSYVYILQSLNCNYSLVFQSGRAVRGRYFSKRYAGPSRLCITLNPTELVSGKVTTIVGKSHATKTCRNYPCSNLLSHAIWGCFGILKRLYEKAVNSDGHDASAVRFANPLLRLSGSNKLMGHISSPLTLQHRTIDMKTRHLQRCHAICSSLLPLLQKYGSAPLAEDKCQTWPAMNCNEVSTDSLEPFSTDDKGSTLYNR